MLSGWSLPDHEVVKLQFRCLGSNFHICQSTLFQNKSGWDDFPTLVLNRVSWIQRLHLLSKSLSPINVVSIHFPSHLAKGSDWTQPMQLKITFQLYEYMLSIATKITRR